MTRLQCQVTIWRISVAISTVSIAASNPMRCASAIASTDAMSAPHAIAFATCGEWCSCVQYTTQRAVLIRSTGSAVLLYRTTQIKLSICSNTISTVANQQHTKYRPRYKFVQRSMSRLYHRHGFA